MLRASKADACIQRARECGTNSHPFIPAPSRPKDGVLRTPMREPRAAGSYFVVLGPRFRGDERNGYGYAPLSGALDLGNAASIEGGRLHPTCPGVRRKLSSAHSRARGNPELHALILLSWVPAFARTSGMVLGLCFAKRRPRSWQCCGTSRGSARRSSAARLRARSRNRRSARDT